MLECMPIYDVFLFCSKLFAPFRGKVVQNCLFGATTHKNIDFTALNAGIRREKNIYFWNHLYHHDHDDHLIPASYVVPKINEYLILRLLGFFGPKSLLVCIPSTTTVVLYVCPKQKPRSWNLSPLAILPLEFQFFFYLIEKFELYEVGVYLHTYCNCGKSL